MLYSMDIRRIQITGGSSFMITLPKDWADSRGLKKNDPVAVIPQSDGSLLLSPGGSSAERESVKTLCIDDFDTADCLYRGLIGAYIAGHDQIVLKSDGGIPGAYLESISEFTQTSMGMEIVDEEEDRIVMKDLIDHSDVIPQKNVKREYLLVKRMIGDALTSDPPGSDDMISRDTEVDRIHWLVQRQSSIHQRDIGLSGRMGLRIESVTRCVGVSKILERMGDHAVMIVKNLERIEGSDRAAVIGGLLSVNSELVRYIECAMNSWLSADHKLAESVIRRKGDMLALIDDSFVEVTGTACDNLIKGSVTRIVEYCSDLAESAINVAMESN